MGVFTKRIWKLDIVKSNLSDIFVSAFNFISFYNKTFSFIKYFCASFLNENATWDY